MVSEPGRRAVEAGFELMTTGDVAAQLLVSEATVRRWIRNGQLRAVRLGERIIRVEQREVARFVRQRQHPPPDP